MASVSQSDELDALQIDISSVLKRKVASIDIVSKDGLRKILLVGFTDHTEVMVHMTAGAVPTSTLESEVATLDYLRSHTSVPVPRILYTNYARTETLRPYIVLEKISGITLDTMWPNLVPFEQDLIVGHITRWMMEVFALRFDQIGSLYPVQDRPGEVIVGSIITPQFYIDGRADYALDRGPFDTAKSYLSGCAQRELDCMRHFFSQDTSPGYQKKVEEVRVNVERSMSTLQNLIERCYGLDEADEEFAQFSLDIHSLSLKSFAVDENDPTQIVSVDFPALITLPLWACARLPTFLQPTLSNDDTDLPVDKGRLSNIFRQTITGVEGYHSVFLRSISLEDTRHALQDVCGYDAFKDNFLLLPALESIAATLPGQEDLEGLEALLDPSTLEGRVARISLLTRGPGALSLAMPMEDITGLDQNDERSEAGTETEPETLQIRVNKVRAASAQISRKVSSESLNLKTGPQEYYPGLGTFSPPPQKVSELE